MFGVRLAGSGAEVTHGPPPAPDAAVVTTTGALPAAFGDADLAGLTAAGALVTGDAGAVRRLVAGVRFPA